jgi:hypothetical protein
MVPSPSAERTSIAPPCVPHQLPRDELAHPQPVLDGPPGRLVEAVEERRPPHSPGAHGRSPCTRAGCCAAPGSRPGGWVAPERGAARSPEGPGTRGATSRRAWRARQCPLRRPPPPRVGKCGAAPPYCAPSSDRTSSGCCIYQCSTQFRTAIALAKSRPRTCDRNRRPRRHQSCRGAPTAYGGVRDGPGSHRGPVSAGAVDQRAARYAMISTAEVVIMPSCTISSRQGRNCRTFSSVSTISTTTGRSCDKEKRWGSWMALCAP